MNNLYYERLAAARICEIVPLVLVPSSLLSLQDFQDQSHRQLYQQFSNAIVFVRNRTIRNQASTRNFLQRCSTPTPAFYTPQSKIIEKVSKTKML